MALNPMLRMLNQASAVMPNNPLVMISQFNDFKKQMAGKDPKAMVEELLKSGKMSQQQFEQLKEQAQSLSSILK